MKKMLASRSRSRLACSGVGFCHYPWIPPFFVPSLRGQGHGERSRLQLHFKLAGTENMAVNVLAVHRPLSLYFVSDGVLHTLQPQNVSFALYIVSKFAALRAFWRFSSDGVPACGQGLDSEPVPRKPSLEILLVSSSNC